MRFSHLLPCLFWLIFGCHAVTTLEAEVVHVKDRDSLIRATRRAEPGTTISIGPGTYQGGIHLTELHGAPGKPIILAAADPDRPPQFRGRNTGIHLTNPAHVELRDLTICDASGNGLNIDDGGSYATPAHHVVLKNMIVRDIGPRGNRDGIKLSGVDQFTLESCTVERWGDGGSAIDMVGCHDGSITGCTFRYRDDVGANGVQTKGGSAKIVIERCRFEHAGSRAVNIGGSTGLPYFRPAAQGYEAKDVTVRDCTFIGSRAPVAFVGVDGAVVKYNTIYRPTRWILRILQETRGESFVPCRNGEFTNNMVVFRNDEISTIVNVGPGTAPETFRFAHNHWYCIDRPGRSEQLSLPTPEKHGTYGVDPQLRAPRRGDLRLQPGSPVRSAGARPAGDE
ncbi:MAG: right-handed parallel beta-helix repeat-containing protein [Planctomycetota bacterium]